MAVISARAAGTTEDLVLDASAVVSTDGRGRFFGMAPGATSGRIHVFSVDASAFDSAPVRV